MPSHNGVYVPPYANPEIPTSQAVIAGEILAWRAWRSAWRIEDDDNARRDHRLYSVYVGTEWVPGEPMWGNVAGGYGVHAYKTKRLARRLYWNIGFSMVYGQVALWGDVVEHKYGYRAEYARPVWLATSNRYLQELYDLEKRPKHDATGWMDRLLQFFKKG